jgi:F0F1-type ATP synthase delta subunit
MKSRDIAKGLYKQKDSVKDADKFINAFIAYVEEKGMEYLLPGVLSHLEILDKKHSQENDLKITFATEPTDQSVKTVTDYMSASTTPEVVVDKNILGGFLAEYNGWSIDATAASYIKNLKQILLAT